MPEKNDLNEQKTVENGVINSNKKSLIAEKEEKILQFWLDNDIFQKSLDKKSKGEFVFYDGPPFATGLPHYGHLLGGTMKDAIPRYQTMKGKKVRRIWGWDCHGLPVENLVEKELGLKNKKDIENFGVDKFNEVAKDSVLRYSEEWEKIIPRTGRFVDMQNAYKTMDHSYTESVWWSFKTLFDKGLIFEGFKPMHLCPRCGTTLSNFEVNQGYKDITDLSVTAKFELVDEPGTFVLAWTTTPWTLSGNVALAINSEIDYVEVEKKDGNTDGVVKFILAKERIKNIFKDEVYKIIKEFKGSSLLGKSYKPLFDYYKNADIKGIENAWKIYGADFVTIEDGTGVVHIAPAFGEDDLNLGKKYNLPFIQHVGMDGKFKKEVVDFIDIDVKPKSDDEKIRLGADIAIIKYLQERNLFFSKEKITHSYPHCWRCSTPLLNYASSSWFFNVPKIKDDLVSANKKINWIPDDIRDGRFGKWLEGAREWAISRSRYWGAPIPVWKCKSCENVEVLGSVDEIRKKTKSSNEYFVMRHGEAEHNVKKIISSKADNPHHITSAGKEATTISAKRLKKEKIDLIISSDFVRGKETAEIVREIIGLEKNAVIYDKRLGEFNFGDFNLKSEKEYFEYLPKLNGEMKKKMPNGESISDAKKRLGDFIYEIDKKYKNKKILFISHETPVWLLTSIALGLDENNTASLRGGRRVDFIKTAEFFPFDFAPIPHNSEYELDFHRPYIDETIFNCKCGGKMNRIKDVFDCWYESGSVAYAQFHYPFENLKTFNPNKNIGFPADFIAEGLDQTRGWFYTSLVLSVALFGKSSYKNVIVNGIVLAEDGQKMSKSLKNYPDPWDVINKYGSDALRYYLLSSPVMKAVDLNFSEKGVDEVVKKVLMRLGNVCSFLEMYDEKSFNAPKSFQSKNILDKWIIARLNELGNTITKAMDKYELDKASRPIADFIEDLSVWYLRRSRDRFKSDKIGDKKEALSTTRFVLFELSKLIAPFMPFMAEDLYQKFFKTGKNKKVKSVHLENWPKFKKADAKLLNEMDEVRKITSLALEARAKAGIKVRQPLSSLVIKKENLDGKKQLISLIEDEVNIKKVLFDKNIEEDIILDTKITEELKEEGDVREFSRGLQDLRKKAGFNISDEVSAIIKTDNVGKVFIQKFEKEIKKNTGLIKIDFEDISGEMIKLSGMVFLVKLF